MKFYQVRWSRLLMFTTCLSVAMCLGLAGFFLVKGDALLRLIAAGLIALVAGASLFMVRGYSITPQEVLIQRLIWETHLSVAGLESAKFEPNAMRWSIRTWGNGGLFSFTGWFHNKRLGSYRAFVTNGNDSVVLRFQDRTIVISPEKPEEFVRELSLATGVKTA